MTTRRQFLTQSSVLLGSGTLIACSAKKQDYDAAVQATWRHSNERVFKETALRRELVRYATLAPSSHNTQCWKFGIAEHAISILPDLSRRCPVVDPDDHHLFVSLGCATENLIQAALANGLKAEAGFDTVRDAVTVILEPTKSVASPLFQAIPERQSTRAEYDGKPISTAELEILQNAGNGKGVRVLLLTEQAAMENVLEYVVQGNTAQMNDRAFVEELKAWIRFSGEQAVRTGDGLYGGSSGNPSVPPWLGSPLFGLFFTPKSENDKYAKHVRSSAGIAIFISEATDKAHWIEAGRCYERFALQSAALGIRNAFLNQPVEVASIRPQFASFLGVGQQRPDLVVRFGRGPTMPKSLRRSVDSVII